MQDISELITQIRIAISNDQYQEVCKLQVQLSISIFEAMEEYLRVEWGYYSLWVDVDNTINGIDEFGKFRNVPMGKVNNIVNSKEEGNAKREIEFKIKWAQQVLHTIDNYLKTNKNYGKKKSK